MPIGKMVSLFILPLGNIKSAKIRRPNLAKLFPFLIPYLQALNLEFIFRCVLNWFGDWSNSALYQVAHEFTIKVDLERADWTKPDFFPVAVQGMFWKIFFPHGLRAHDG